MHVVHSIRAILQSMLQTFLSLIPRSNFLIVCIANYRKNIKIYFHLLSRLECFEEQKVCGHPTRTEHTNEIQATDYGDGWVSFVEDN